MNYKDFHNMQMKRNWKYRLWYWWYSLLELFGIKQ